MRILFKPEWKVVYGHGLADGLLAEEATRVADGELAGGGKGAERALRVWYRWLADVGNVRIALLDETVDGWSLRYVFGQPVYTLVKPEMVGVLDFERKDAFQAAWKWQAGRPRERVVVCGKDVFLT